MNWVDALARGRAASRWLTPALLAVGWLSVVAWLHAAGFSHISDDDFARTVIAERWVAAWHGAPSPEGGLRAARWVQLLDPSGSSWLPAPFWLTGASMALFGRELAIARLSQLLWLLLALWLLWRNLRATLHSETASWCVLLLGLSTPYALWLAASLSPDAWVGALAAAAVVALSSARPDALSSAALWAAALSRYETWPLVCVHGLRYALAAREAAPNERARTLGLAVLPALGPLGWMAWNAFAHDDALHFFARVARYREAEQPLPLAARIGMVWDAGLDLLGGYGVCVMLLGALGVLCAPRPLRRRWSWPLAALASLPAFLLLGSLLNGAPTHHPARALLVVSFAGAALIWVGWGALIGWVNTRYTASRGAMVVAALAFAFVFAAVDLFERSRDWPGRFDQARDAQLSAGYALRARGAERLQVQPCRYEHFALLAAFGAPERVELQPARPCEAEPCQCPLVTLP